MMPGISYLLRRRAKHPSEEAQLARLKTRQPHRMSDAELAEIRDDWDAGFARELANNEIERRAGLTAHQRIAEAARRVE